MHSVQKKAKDVYSQQRHTIIQSSFHHCIFPGMKGAAQNMPPFRLLMPLESLYHEKLRAKASRLLKVWNSRFLKWLYGVT